MLRPALLLLWLPATRAGGAAPDPYRYLHGVDCTSRPFVPASPDPLHRCAWANHSEELQIFYLRPATTSARPASAFIGAEGLSREGAAPTVVRGPGSLMFDFGQESAAWLEFDSADLRASADVRVLMSVSEYSAPGVVNGGATCNATKGCLANKTQPPTRWVGKRGVDTYRLELNPEL